MREVVSYEIFFLTVAVMATAVTWRFHAVIAVIMWIAVVGYPIGVLVDRRLDRADASSSDES